MKMPNIYFATMLAIVPLTSVLAQGSGPATKTDSTVMKDGSATNSHQAGATGSTVVPGDKSTIAGDHKATVDTKTGGVAGGK